MIWITIKSYVSAFLKALWADDVVLYFDRTVYEMKKMEFLTHTHKNYNNNKKLILWR